MADTTVDSEVHSSLDTVGLWGPYWSDKNTAVVIYANNNLDLLASRTTDAGANWTEIALSAAGTVNNIACWYDKETPGNTGTLVHVAHTDAVASDLYYRTIDVSDASLGTERTVDSTVTIDEIINRNRVAITKTVNDNLLIALSTQTEIECYRSTNSGANWTDIADVFETATEEDWVLLFPADVDDGDACALFWDRGSANEISIKMYDDSANSWTETSIATTVFDDDFHINMDGAIRHSDNHLLMAFHSDDDNSGDDLRTNDLTVDSIASPTVTAKWPVFSNQGESAQVAVFINQQNDDVYISWCSGAPTWQATVDTVYKKSTNGMAFPWGTEQAYSEATADDLRVVQAGRTVGDAGGRYQPVFNNDDLRDLFVNLTNDIEIAAVVVGTRRIFIT